MTTPTRIQKNGVNQRDVLLFLQDADEFLREHEGFTTRELAEWLLIPWQHVYMACRRLENKGLIERRDKAWAAV